MSYAGASGPPSKVTTGAVAAFIVAAIFNLLCMSAYTRGTDLAAVSHAKEIRPRRRESGSEEPRQPRQTPTGAGFPGETGARPLVTVKMT